MAITLSAFALLGTLVPRAHAFMGVLSFPHSARSREGRVHMFERRSDAAVIAVRAGDVRSQRGVGRLLMASEEVGYGGREFQL